MTIGRRPKRHNPKAERLTFRAELEQCPRCGEPLSSEGCTAHSAKTVQTLEGEFYVVAYSRRCRNPECANCGQHVHAVLWSDVNFGEAVTDVMTPLRASSNWRVMPGPMTQRP